MCAVDQCAYSVMDKIDSATQPFLKFDTAKGDFLIFDTRHGHISDM